MLTDLRRSLDACLRSWLPGDVDVAFGAPNVDISLSVFCFDVREDESISAANGVLVRDDNGRVAGWQLPIKRYRVSFLLCGDEAALDAVLLGCAQNPTIPTSLLTGVLAESGLAVQLGCAPAEAAVSAIGVWSALRLPPRLSITLVAMVPLVPPLRTDLAPPARELSLGISAEGITPTDPAPAADGARRWAKASIRE